METSNEEQRLAIWSAVDTGDFVRAKALLSEDRSSIGALDDDGVTLLHLAAVQGNRDLLNLILDAGIDINVADNTGQTPLHYAAWNGSTEAATRLLERGADVFAEDEGGDTPANFADDAGHQATADLLHAAEREATDLSEYENTPAGAAGPSGSPATVRQGGTLDEEQLIRVLHEEAGFIKQSAERAYSQLFLTYLGDHAGVGVDLDHDLDEEALWEERLDFESEYRERITALATYYQGYTSALEEVIDLVRGKAGPIGIPGRGKFVGVYDGAPDLSLWTDREKAALKRRVQRSRVDIRDIVDDFRERDWI